MASTSKPLPRELGAEEFVAREEEKLRAYGDAWDWARGPGGFFFANALRNASPGQVRGVVAAMRRIELQGSLGAAGVERVVT